MQPTLFKELVTEHGEIEKYSAGQVFHTQDFPNKLFFLKTGYVKRYQATKPEQKVLELIYGPGHIISLSQLYKRLFGVDQNQDNFIYIYQAMTDVEMCSLQADFVEKELEANPLLYKDFFYESGIKLRSNISRLASNAVKDEYKKVAHLLVSLAYEFGSYTSADTNKTITLPLPQSALDIAEQLNMSKEVAAAILNSLSQNNIIEAADDDIITIVDMDVLKDVYL
jgi:CRP-like cAMP-binding protein